MTNSILGVHVNAGKGFAVRITELLKDKEDDFLRGDDFQKICVTVNLSLEGKVSVTAKRSGNGIDDDPVALDSFAFAVRYVAWLEGKRHSDPVVFGIQTVEERPGMYPKMEGGSMFGPAVMLLLKNASQRTDRGWLGGCRTAIRAVQLDRVAVSAAFDSTMGTFAKVDPTHKLEALERLKAPPVVFVLPDANSLQGTSKSCKGIDVKYSSTPFRAYEDVFRVQVHKTLFPNGRK